MFLRRLEINGFKSFAGKALLELEPGITAIVGPNGSGKSNIADAIRWSLGEQSGKQLRLKKSEELVFAGTEKKAKASVAEVSMLLDNTDGALAIDFSEVQLSRRLYRSGESDYLMNTRKVRLSEVQQLLIAAGFGPNSYSVIGQGMIDTFVLATPAERKLLFDEASGIRQYELKREQSLRKLEATFENLTRVRDIVAELAPRLATLTRAVEAAQQRQNLEGELSSKRSELISTATRNYSASIKDLGRQLSQLKQRITQQETKLTQLETERDNQLKAQSEAKRSQQSFSRDLAKLEVERDKLTGDLSVKRAELQYLVERAESQASQSEWLEQAGVERQALKRKIQQLADKLAEASKIESTAQNTMEAFSKDIQRAQTRLTRLRRDWDQADRGQFVTLALEVLKELARSLANSSAAPEQTKLLVYKAGRLLSHANRGQTEAQAEIRQAQNSLNELMKQREEAHNEYTKAVIKLRAFELDQAHLTAQLKSLDEREAEAKTQFENQSPASAVVIDRRTSQLVRLEERLSQLTPELADLREKLSQGNQPTDSADIFELAGQLESARSAVNAASENYSTAQQQLVEAESGLQKYHDLQVQWFGKAKITTKPTTASLEDLERELAIIAAKLADNSQADRETIEEYQEVKQRHDFMAEQIADLDNAQADLLKVIGQLEELIKAKFESAFAEISAQFSNYFQQLFSGGRASLQLASDEGGTYGIEIKAVPPGKRVESLAMLSGGERALTGIALLGAILRVNPSPFVVLDEVDAALDEANSARFSKMLADIAKRCQLLVITHNRQTMQAAHSLFGVTMDEHHVSRLLSLRLEEARELAAK